MNQDQPKTDGAAPVSSTPLLAATDRELLDEILRRANARLEEMNPVWTRDWTLRNLLYDAGKIIAEWDGLQANDAHHWRRGKGARHSAEAESRRPVHVPG